MLVVQIDTASGVVNDIEAIGKAIKAAGHPALFMVDAVASLGCMPFEMDAWGVDVAMSGSQKGLMTPPGLGFVAANDRAPRGAQDGRTCARPIGTGPSARAPSITANMPAPRRCICCSRCARPSTCCSRRGSRTSSGAIACWPRRCAAPSASWAEGQVLGFNIAEAGERSDTVTTVMMSDGHDPAALQRYCKEKCGVVLGVGIGELAGKAFRIAHMGHVNAPMILGTLGVDRGRPRRARHPARQGRHSRPRSNGSANRSARERACDAVESETGAIR